jgi:hypothetical protein
VHQFRFDDKRTSCYERDEVHMAHSLTMMHRSDDDRAMPPCSRP